MKKLFLAALAVLTLAFSANANALDTSFSVAGTNNYLSRSGSSLSNDGFSGSASLKLKFDYNVFFKYDLHMVSFGEDDGTNLEHKFNVGYSNKLGPVTYTLGRTENVYTGPSIGMLSSRIHNYGEYFVEASAYGLYTKVAQITNPTVWNNKNTYYKLGYTTPALFGVTGDVGTSWTNYDSTDVMRHTASNVGLSYKLGKVNTSFVYMFGGHTATNKQIPNATSFIASVNF